MPNTFVGLLVFIVLTTPGLLYLLVAERGARPTRTYSVFRETVTVGVVSLAANSAALAIFAVLLATPLAARLPDVERLVRDPGPYWLSEFRFLLGWAGALLLLACVIAVLVARWHNVVSVAPARARGGEVLRSVARWLVPNGGVEFVSGWWKLIELPEAKQKAKRITCVLSDNSRIQGWYFSHGAEAGDGPDRDLLLSAPFTFQDCDGTIRHAAKGAVSISARNIVLLHVTYEDR